MPRINLLPWRDQQRRDRKLAFFVALGGAVALAAIAAFIAYLLLGSMIDAQEHRNERLRAQIKVLDKQIEEINDLDAQKQKFISRMQIIEKLQRSRPEVVHLFDELVKEMPDGTYLTSVKQTGTKLKLDGVAQSSTRVSALMRNISASQWMRNPELEVVQTKSDTAGSSFVLDAEQVSLPDSDEAGTAKRPVRAGSGSTK
ncbi:MAG: PilN domain-containing protein [Steroidobacterales bacterium]